MEISEIEHFQNRVFVEVTPMKLLRVAAKVVDLVIRKNKDYGDAWQMQGINGVLVRLCDKLYRVENIQGREALVASESVKDTLEDAIGYALLGLLYLEACETVAITK
jgi:hypothetical protein